MKVADILTFGKRSKIAGFTALYTVREGLGGLENRCAGIPRTVGSNPTLSAKRQEIRNSGDLFCFS